MKKKDKKFIIDDFNNTYNFKVNKEEVYNQLGIERNINNDTCPRIWMKLGKTFMALSIVLSCILIVIVSGVIVRDKDINRLEEFPDEVMDYFEEYTGKRYAEIYHSFEIDNKIKIDIFRIQSDIDTNYYYFYIINTENKISDVYLYLDEKISINDNSYGILSIKTEKELNEDIIFSIETNQKITEIKIK